VQQRNANLFTQVVRVEGHSLQVLPKQENLGELGRPAHQGRIRIRCAGKEAEQPRVQPQLDLIARWQVDDQDGNVLDQPTCLVGQLLEGLLRNLGHFRFAEVGALERGLGVERQHMQPSLALGLLVTTRLGAQPEPVPGLFVALVLVQDGTQPLLGLGRGIGFQEQVGEIERRFCRQSDLVRRGQLRKRAARRLALAQLDFQPGLEHDGVDELVLLLRPIEGTGSVPEGFNRPVEVLHQDLCCPQLGRAPVVRNTSGIGQHVQRLGRLPKLPVAGRQQKHGLGILGIAVQFALGNRLCLLEFPVFEPAPPVFQGGILAVQAVLLRAMSRASAIILSCSSGFAQRSCPAAGKRWMGSK
jgi:hypothetical protein